MTKKRSLRKIDFYIWYDVWYGMVWYDIWDKTELKGFPLTHRPSS